MSELESDEESQSPDEVIVRKVLAKSVIMALWCCWSADCEIVHLVY